MLKLEIVTITWEFLGILLYGYALHATYWDVGLELKDTMSVVSLQP